MNARQWAQALEEGRVLTDDQLGHMRWTANVECDQGRRSALCEAIETAQVARDEQRAQEAAGRQAQGAGPEAVASTSGLGEDVSAEVAAFLEAPSPQPPAPSPETERTPEPEESPVEEPRRGGRRGR